MTVREAVSIGLLFAFYNGSYRLFAIHLTCPQHLLLPHLLAGISTLVASLLIRDR